MSDYGVRLEWKGHVVIMTFDRPERLNAFDEKMWGSFEEALTKLKEKLPRALVVTGAGERSFSAGFDINPENPQVANLIEAVMNRDRGPVDILINRVRKAVDELVFLPVPVIAALNGDAYGGGAEIAVRCDMRVMDPGACISFSEVKLGLMPDHGGVVGLTRLVGPGRAADLILTARKIPADEALKLGIVNRISAHGKALEEAEALARGIAEMGPRAVRHALEVIRRTPDIPQREALDLETEKAVTLIASGECYHGILAFLEKKKPEFPDPPD
ncbi:MAG: enoyl-CoA hydratase/isomerase family protein [Deltaproteobacteria bacterium]|nr:enoyl-CoA hydratase/isomerase family protein [Deltaproteobacteria bacterium]